MSEQDQMRSTRKKYLLPILYFTVFLFLYGENIQPAPRTQIYESIICRDRYGDESSSLGTGNDNLCKSRDVQEELAFLKGMERLLGALPSNHHPQDPQFHNLMLSPSYSCYPLQSSRR